MPAIAFSQLTNSWLTRRHRWQASSHSFLCVLKNGKYVMAFYY
ncbi:hypothetical protein PMI23_05815 [Pseudomonas sp. GM24]|nr:hypothetical protein PMI23_05815 [Pseudomonas sp. GM24]